MARNHGRSYCEYADANFRFRSKGEPCPFCGREIGHSLDANPIADAELVKTEDGEIVLTGSSERPVSEASMGILAMVRGLGWFFLWGYVASVLVVVGIFTEEDGWLIAAGVAGLIGFFGLLGAYLASSGR